MIFLLPNASDLIFLRFLPLDNICSKWLRFVFLYFGLEYEE